MNDEMYITAAEKAYRIIRDRIISGDLQAGEKLSRRNMANLTGVSIIPVIEALHRLEAEGLVESRPRWGSRVIQPNHEYVRDKYALREAVECQVVKMLCGRASPEQINDLRTLARRIDHLQKIKDMEAFWDEHHLFHVRMAEYTGCQSLVDALHRINFFYLLQRAEFEAQQILDAIPPNNHELLVNAIESGDPAYAEDVMCKHIYQSGLVSREEVHGASGSRNSSSPFR